MMIVGYDEGTEVKWVEDNHGFQTGIIRARYYDSGQYEVDGHEINITVIGESPVYVVIPDHQEDEDVIVLDHNTVLRKHLNPHT